MTFGAGATSQGGASTATLTGDTSTPTPLSGLVSVDGEGRYFPAWWGFTAPPGVTRVWFDVTGSTWAGDEAAVNSDAQLYDSTGAAADYWLEEVVGNPAPLGLRYRLVADVTPGESYTFVAQAVDDTGSGVTAWVVQASGFVVSYAPGEWVQGDDWSASVPMLSLSRTQRGRIITTPEAFPLIGPALPDTIRQASQEAETADHEDLLDGQVEGFYGGDVEAVVHVTVGFNVDGYAEGEGVAVYAEWRRPPRVFQRPSPPTLTVPPLPDGAVGYETSGTYTISNATLEAVLDHYNGAHYVSPEPTVPSGDLTADGGVWSEGLYVDNEHAVWASPVSFDHYEANFTVGDPGTLIDRYETDATTHGAQTTETVDVTDYLDANGNICLYVSPAINMLPPTWQVPPGSAPAITPTYNPAAGITQKYQLWWGGDLSQVFSRLHYTYTAPSYRYLYETLTLFGTTPPLRHLTRRDGLNSTAGRVTGGRSQQGTLRRVSGHW